MKIGSMIISFGNSAKFWLGLQGDYDLEEEHILKKKEFEYITP